MNKRNTKRGFTITELVIVIVVIAILAAVLIPTFASLIKKANQSADIQAARQMDVALQGESAAKKPTTLKEVIDILSKAGYDAEGSLKPITKNHTFYWYKNFNVIVLANEEETTPVVLYPTKNKDLEEAFVADLAKTGAEQELFDLEKGFRQFVKIEVESANDVVAALSRGQSVTLTKDVEIKQPMSVPAGSNATIDLNGNTLTTAKSGTDKHEYAVQNAGTVTVTNGTFNSRGIMNNAGSKLIIKDATVNAMDGNGGGCVRNKKGGEVIIEGGTFNVITFSDWNAGNYGGAAGVYNDGGTITINGGKFTTVTDAYLVSNVGGGTMTINGGDFTAYRGALACTDGTITVNNGKFAVTNDSNGGWVAYAEGAGKIVIKGGTFTTVTDRMFTGNVEDKR